MKEWEVVPAVYTGSREADDRANTRLYWKLSKIGGHDGYQPVLMPSDMARLLSSSFERQEAQGKEILGKIDRGNVFAAMGKRLFQPFGDNESNAFLKEFPRLELPRSDAYLQLFEQEMEETPSVFEEKVYSNRISFAEKSFVLVPVSVSWEIPAYVLTGDGQGGLSTMQHTILAKLLYEKFEVFPTAVSMDGMEYCTVHPLQKKEEVEEAARLLCAGNPQVYSDIETAVKFIYGKHHWSLLWKA